MNKFNKSQILILSLLTLLLIIVPLLSSSLRLTYIYFITNLLIIALGAEAGLLSFFSNPINNNVTIDKNNPQNDHQYLLPTEQDKKGPDDDSKNTRVVDKCLSTKVIASVKVEKVKKCPSMPSLFFIGNDNNTNNNNDNYNNNNELLRDDNYWVEDDDCEEKEGVVGEISGQELFAKAENFIGNFYKQLKMQREESWKRIHGFYQRAF